MVFISNISHDLLSIKPKKHTASPSNIPEETKEAIQNMTKWKDRVIRPFDKGSGLFILDREDYIKRTEVHTNDENTFVKIRDKEEAINNAIHAVKSWVDQYKKEEGMSDPNRKELCG